MEKWLSRTVMVDGVLHRQAIVEVDECGKLLAVRPYLGEEHSTAYTDSAIIIDTDTRDVKFEPEFCDSMLK